MRGIEREGRERADDESAVKRSQERFNVTCSEREREGGREEYSEVQNCLLEVALTRVQRPEGATRRHSRNLLQIDMHLRVDGRRRGHSVNNVVNSAIRSDKWRSPPAPRSLSLAPSRATSTDGRARDAHPRSLQNSHELSDYGEGRGEGISLIQLTYK